MKAVSYCNRIIEYSYYAIFFLVPIVFAGNTSELFEFNKMWLTFGLTIIIGILWLSKMVLEKKIFIQRTPLDIPLILFLLSQIISSIFSLDPHISLWGYYSRFNGGLLSTITYIFLYYAFVSNLEVKHVYRLVIVSLFSGLFVALWGLPSRFGYDPTCFVFRGTLDTNCWTDAFKPTVRIFSTLGQPAWLAAYLAVLLPLVFASLLKNSLSNMRMNTKNHSNKNTTLRTTYYVLLTTLFYLDLIFTDTRAGFIAFWVANSIFWIAIFWKNIFSRQVFFRWLLILNLLLLVCNFFFGIPIGSLSRFTWPSLQKHLIQSAHAQTSATAPASPSIAPTQAAQPAQTPASSDTSITDSGRIRLYVWEGAIDAWKANPFFGTGVETFAFAYYTFRPAGHNMTSEWDYLYNKAHNEFLNYLTTTGIFGLGSYLAIIGVFLYLVLVQFLKKKISANLPAQQPQKFHKFHESQADLTPQNTLIVTALVSGYISILVSNFFGFSVVIMNLYLFLIPVFVFMLAGMINPNYSLTFFSTSSETNHVNPYQWTGIFIFILVGGYLILGLFRYWYADVAYALGYNLDHVNAYQQAYQQLEQAVNAEPGEPTYKDEYSLNLAVLAASLTMQKDIVNAPQVAKQAIDLSDEITTNHPNNVIFWKDRVKMFYTLAQGDTANQQAYLQQALQAMTKASELAPTDAKIWYNLGVLYGQNGDIDKGINTLNRTIALKPDYRDAYYALGLFYHEKAIDKNNRVIDPDMQQKAIATYQYVLDHINPNDTEVKKSLQTWEK